MKQRTLQACNSRHSTKKSFLFRANWTCLSRAGGESSPPLSSLATRLSLIVLDSLFVILWIWLMLRYSERVVLIWSCYVRFSNILWSYKNATCCNSTRLDSSTKFFKIYKCICRFKFPEKNWVIDTWRLNLNYHFVSLHCL